MRTVVGGIPSPNLQCAPVVQATGCAHNPVVQFIIRWRCDGCGEIYHITVSVVRFSHHRGLEREDSVIVSRFDCKNGGTNSTTTSCRGA